MTTPEEANQGLYPTKGLNHQILLQLEAILESHPDFYARLRARYDGKIVVEDSQTAHVPQVRRTKDTISVHIPDEWYAFVFLLTSAAYFGMYSPIDRAIASGRIEVEVDEGDQQLINEALNSVRQFVNAGSLQWPKIMPDTIDEANPDTKEWQSIKSVYIAAILFIMLHEFSHIVNDDLQTSSSIAPDESKDRETRCDVEAAEWILTHYNGGIGASDQMGIVIALGAGVAYTKNAPSISHPEPLTRATTLFNNLDLELTDTLKLINTGVLVWVAKIAGVSDHTIDQIVSELDIDRVYGDVVAVLRMMA